MRGRGRTEGGGGEGGEGLGGGDCLGGGGDASSLEIGLGGGEGGLGDGGGDFVGGLGGGGDNLRKLPTGVWKATQLLPSVRLLAALMPATVTLYCR